MQAYVNSDTVFSFYACKVNSQLVHANYWKATVYSAVAFVSLLPRT